MKKNFIKKIATVALATSIMTFGFTGCGDSGKVDEKTAADATEATSSTEDKTEAEKTETTETASETEAKKAGETDTELKKVTIAATGLDGTLTEVARIAQSQGYFEEELAKVGYEPDYQGFAQAGPAINEAFGGGTIDLAFYGDLPALTAISNGIDIKVVASATSQLDYAILAGENSEIASVSDLKGKKIAVGFGTVTYKYLDELLKSNGLSTSDIEIINTNVDGPTMLASNQIDAFVTQYGAGVNYQRAGVGKIVISTKDTPDLSGELILAARTDFIESDRDAVVAIVKALNDAYSFAVENPDDVAAAIATDNFPAEIQAQVYTDHTYAAFNPTLADIAKAKLASMKEYGVSNQFFSSSFEIDDILDLSIQEDAAK